jgi:hypothetical protein
LVVGLTEQHNREQFLPIFRRILSGGADGHSLVERKHYAISPKPLRIDLWTSGSRIIFHSLEGGGAMAGFNVSICLRMT